MTTVEAEPPISLDRFSFEPVTEPAAIRQVMIHPKVYKHITDDSAPEPEDFQPRMGPGMVYLGAYDGREFLGIWLFVERNSVCLEAHTMLLPCAYGERGAAAAKACERWIWEHTPCQRIITEVPSYNLLAYRFAIEAGFKAFGRNLKAWKKDGKLHDLIMLGLSRPSAA